MYHVPGTPLLTQLPIYKSFESKVRYIRDLIWCHNIRTKRTEGIKSLCFERRPEGVRDEISNCHVVCYCIASYIIKSSISPDFAGGPSNNYCELCLVVHVL